MDKLNVLLAIVLSFCFVSFANAEEKIDLKTGLVVCYDFDEGSGTVLKDKSGKGNDGKINGAKYVKGRYGTALEFDGKDDCVDCGNNDSLNMPGREITIALWMRTDHRKNGAYRLISKKATYTDNEGYELTFRSGGCVVEMSGSGPTFVIGRKKGLNASWHHIVGTIRDTGTDIEGVIYADGKEIGRQSTAAFASGENHLCIGCSKPGMGHFKGTIDEVRIYNRALTATEVKALHKEKETDEEK